MKIYVEPPVFFFAFDKSDVSILPRKIFERVRLGKVEVVTSIWSISQYIGGINELYVKGDIKLQSRNDFLFEFSRLESDLKTHLIKVYPTKEIQDVCIGYILDRDVDYERAWHLATARLSGCAAYVMVDKFQDIDKKQWKKEFDIFNILDEKDVEEFLEKINSL